MAVYKIRDIQIAVDRSEQAANTYLNVATVQNDWTAAEFEMIKTLKRRIDDHLNTEAPKYKGKDGISVTKVEIIDQNVLVHYSDGDVRDYSDIFTDVIPKTPDEIIGYYVKNDELFEKWTSGDQSKGVVNGDPGKQITNLEVQDDGDVEVTVNDGTVYTFGNLDNYAEDPITAVDTVGPDLYIQINGVWESEPVGRNKGENGESGIIPTEDALYIEDTTNDQGEREFYIRLPLESGQVLRIGPTPATYRVADVEETLQLEWNGGDDVYFTLMTGKRLSFGSFNATDGIDGKDWTPVRKIDETRDWDLRGDAPYLRLRQPAGYNQSFAGKYIDRFADDASFVDARINSAGEVILDIGFSDVVTGDLFIDNVNIGKAVGDDGVTLSGVQIKTNGDIEATYNDNGSLSTTVLGNVAYDEVVDAGIQPATGLVYVELASGLIMTSSRTPNGKDGVATLVHEILTDSDNEFMLTIRLSNGDRIEEIGKLRPIQNHSADVTPEGDLYVNFVGDDAPVLVGNIRGTDATRSILEVRFDGSKMEFLLDGVTDPEAVDGKLRRFVSVDYDDTTELLTFQKDDGTEYSLSYVRPDDGDHGRWVTKWTVENDHREGNRLTVELSDDTTPIEEKLIDGKWISGMWWDAVDSEDLIVEWKATNYTDIQTLGTLDDIHGHIGVFPESVKLEGIELWVRDWTDGRPDMNLGTILARWIEAVGYEGEGDVYIKYNLDDTNTGLGFVDLNGNEAEFITAMTINDSRDYIVTWNDGNDAVISLPLPIDGIDSKYPVAFSRDGDLFTFNMQDGSTLTATIDNFDGILPKWITEFVIDDTDPEDRRFKVRYAQSDYDLNETVDDELTDIGPADGEDARWIESFRRDGDDFFIKYNDTNEEVLGNIVSFDGEHGSWVVGLHIDDSGADRKLIATWDDGSTTNLGNIDGMDFKSEITDIRLVDGNIEVENTLGEVTVSSEVVVKRVLDAYTDSDHLIIDTNHGVEYDAGYSAGVDYPDGDRPVNVYHDVEANQLIFVMESGFELEAGEFIRNRIIDAYLGGPNNGNLMLKRTDGTEYDLGWVRGSGSNISVVDAFINQHYQLIITLNADEQGYPRDPLVIDGVRGGDGVGIADINIVEYELIFTLEDGSEINVGNVDVDFGFAPYDPWRDYNRGETCTFDGRAYVALVDGVDSDPSVGPWVPMRFETDPTPDAGAPDLISPIEGALYPNLKPVLVGGEFRNYYSVDKRVYREFQVDEVGGNFVDPIYTGQENIDYHQVPFDLEQVGNYVWRARDVVETGYATSWTMPEFFKVISSSIAQPMVSVADGLNPVDMPAMASFVSTQFIGSGSHVSSSWQIKSVETDSLIYQDLESDDLTDTTLLFGILLPDTQYMVRVMHHSGSEVSAWSEWVSFTTAEQFDNPVKPVISYVGDDLQATTAKPSFRSRSNLGSVWDAYMAERSLTAEWEVYDAAGDLVWTAPGELIWGVNSAIDIDEVRINRTLESGVTHSVRVRYSSDLFIGPSEWSDFLDFTPLWNIETPTINLSSGSVLNVPPRAIFVITPFVSEADEFRFAILTINDADGVPKYRKVFDDISDLQVEFDFSVEDSERFFDVYIQYIGFNGESEFSEPLEIRTQLMFVPVVLTGSSDNTMRMLDAESGEELWIYSFPATVRAVAMDSRSRSFGAVGSDLTALSGKGAFTWSKTEPSTINSLSTNIIDDLYVAGNYGRLAKFDRDSTIEWIGNTGTTETLTWTDSSPSGAVVVHGDNVRWINKDGDLEWVTTVTGSSTCVFTDGDLIAVGNSSGGVTILTRSAQQLAYYRNHTSSVNGVAIDGDGYVVSASSDNTVKKYHRTTGDVEWTYTGFTSTVYEVSIDAARHIYAASADRTARKIAPDGSEVWKYEGHTNNVRRVEAKTIQTLLNPPRLSKGIVSSAYDGLIEVGEPAYITANPVLSWDLDGLIATTPSSVVIADHYETFIEVGEPAYITANPVLSWDLDGLVAIEPRDIYVINAHSGTIETGEPAYITANPVVNSET